MKQWGFFLLAFIGSTGWTLAQDGPVTARQALAAVQARFGAEAAGRVFEVRANEGLAQPEEWWLTASDLERSDVLHDFWTDGRRVTDEGRNTDFYPEKLPKGFFSAAKLRLDSTQAFAIAEQLARDAGVGFEQVNYLLHGREYSDEPVWTLSLLNEDEQLLGSVHLSAESGKVLRTVWVKLGKRGRFQIVDSARDRIVPAQVPASAPAPLQPSGESEFGTASITGEAGPGEIDPAESDLPVPAETEEKFRRQPATVPAPPARLPVAPAGDGEVPEIIKLKEADEQTR